MVAVAALAVGALPAAALTEARIIKVTCGGLTVVQTGLPPRAAFEVEAINGFNGRRLEEREVRSSPTGQIRVRLHTDLRGIHRLHAEVERSHVKNSEYGEADVDLDGHCRVVGARPVPVPTPSPSSTAASTPPTTVAVDGPDPDSGWPWEATAGIAAGFVVLVAAGAWWIRRRAHAGS